MGPASVKTVFRTLASYYHQWHAEAKCLGMDDSLFFGSSDPDTRPPYTLAEIRKAQAICGECPVAYECLVDALENREDYGVWAGTTSKRRRSMLEQIEQGMSMSEVTRVWLVELRTKSKVSPGPSTGSDAVEFPSPTSRNGSSRSTEYHSAAMM